jgi:hypothetical protein
MSDLKEWNLSDDSKRLRLNLVWYALSEHQYSDLMALTQDAVMEQGDDEEWFLACISGLGPNSSVD